MIIRELIEKLEQHAKLYGDDANVIVLEATESGDAWDITDFDYDPEDHEVYLSVEILPTREALKAEEDTIVERAPEEINQDESRWAGIVQ